MLHAQLTVQALQNAQFELAGQLALRIENVSEENAHRILRETVLSGNDTFLQLLLAQPAFVEHLATDDNFVLRLAAQENRAEMVQSLLQHERVARQAHVLNNQAVRSACRNGNRPIFEMLVQQENVIRDIAINHNEPLRIAEQYQNDDIVCRLLGMPAVLNALETTPANVTFTNDNVEHINIFEQPPQRVTVPRHPRRILDEQSHVDLPDAPPDEQELGNLANQHENAMGGLGPNEAQALAQIQERYQNEFNRKGLDHIFLEIRNYLEAKYQERPVEYNGQQYDLQGRPYNNQGFRLNLNNGALKRAVFYTTMIAASVALGYFFGLTAVTTFLLATTVTLVTSLCDKLLVKGAAMQALRVQNILLPNEVRKQYYQHKVHSGWRFLFQHPNPWISPRAHYTQLHLTGFSAAISYNDKVRIAYMWLAASDETRQLPEGFTKHTQLKKRFVEVLHEMNRAHNWDKTRLNDAGKEEEYDDLEGDKPSCSVGLTKRIVQYITLFLNDNPKGRVLTQQLVVTRFKEQMMACNDSENTIFEKIKKASAEEREQFKEALDSLVLINLGDWGDLEENEQQMLNRYLPSDAQRDQFVNGCKAYWGDERIEREQELRYQDKRFNNYPELIAHLSQHCLEDNYNAIVEFIKSLQNPNPNPNPATDNEPSVTFLTRENVQPENVQPATQPIVSNDEGIDNDRNIRP